VMPGFVETEGFPQRAVLASGFLRRFVIEPEDVAVSIVEAVEKGKREVTIPWFPYRLTSIIQALAPGLFARIARGSGYRKDERPPAE
jgi:short-subunit dehydrogenase